MPCVGGTHLLEQDHGVIERLAWPSRGPCIVGLGGPVNDISAEEGAAVEKTPGDVARGWELWTRKARGQ